MLPCQRDGGRVVVMILVEVRIEVARVSHAMEDVEGKVLTDEKEHEGQKESDWIWYVLYLKTKGLLPIVEVQIQVD